MKWQILQEIVELYSHIDVFLLCVDRDCEPSRRTKLANIEKKIAPLFPRKVFLAENAWQEIEVWVLAGHSLPREWQWKDVRAERDPKERYFQPFAAMKGVLSGPGDGRQALANQAAKKYKRIRRLCPEDIQSLENRLKAALLDR